MAIYQQRIGDVALNNGQFIVDAHLRYVINNINSTTSRHVRGLDNPIIILSIIFFPILFESLYKIPVLVREHVRFWQEIPLPSSVLVLHSLVIYAQTVFARYFMTLREMIYLLEFVQALVQV